jgi:hypothetical protein
MMENLLICHRKEKYFFSGIEETEIFFQGHTNDLLISYCGPMCFRVGLKARNRVALACRVLLQIFKSSKFSLRFHHSEMVPVW